MGSKNHCFRRGDGGGLLPSSGRCEGFTLVEMSIILVIISLIIGGIMIGKEMIRQSQLQSILSDLNSYKSAVATFKLKYDYLPGDIPNATDFWGFPASATAPYTTWTNCYAAGFVQNEPLGSTKTCNGNGNGMISSGMLNYGALPVSTTPCINGIRINALQCDFEQFAVWHHLANAGLISGIFTPSKGGNVVLAYRPIWVRGVPGANMPSSKFNPVEGFVLLYVCGITDNFVWSNACGHYFVYGAQITATTANTADFPYNPTLTTAEALAIDSKMDDGKPGSGTVLSSKHNGNVVTAPTGALCASTTSAVTSIYDLTQTGPQCALYFQANF